MALPSIVGHEQPIRSLWNALESGHVAGTYLFVGPTGVGKTTVAMAFAQAAACRQPERNPYRACTHCESCRRLDAGTHPEVSLIAPAGGQTQIWQFWDRDNRPPGVLQHTIAYSPAIGARRVYIIERADTLNESAANSLLKVLEEPPPYALFILLSPHAARLLPTILSRAQVVRLNPAPVRKVAEHLSAALGLDADRAATLAAYSEGRVGTALQLTRNPAVGAEIGRVVELALWIAAAPPIRAMKAGESIRKLSSSLKALTESDGAMQADAAAKGADAPAAKSADASDRSESAAVDSEAESAPKERAGRRQVGLVIDLIAAVYGDLAALSMGGGGARVVHADQRQALAAISAARPADQWIHGLKSLLAARRRVDQNASIPLLTDWLAMELIAP